MYTWLRNAIGLLTGVLGHGHDLGKELSKVGEVGAEEASLDDEAFTGVRGGQLATKELRLASNSEGRSSLGGLRKGR